MVGSALGEADGTLVDEEQVDRYAITLHVCIGVTFPLSLTV